MRRRKIDWRQILTIGALSLLALWLASLIWRLGSKASLAWRQAHETAAQYESLETRKATLQANLDALGTPRGQDAAIREAFGVARPGEEVIVVVPPATSTATTTVRWWRQIWEWL